MNSDIGNYRKNVNLSLYTTQTYMRRRCVYAFILYLSNSTNKLNITKYNVSIC